MPGASRFAEVKKVAGGWSWCSASSGTISSAFPGTAAARSAGAAVVGEAKAPLPRRGGRERGAAKERDTVKVWKVPSTAETAAALVVQQALRRLRRETLRERLRPQVTSWMVQKIVAESRRFGKAQSAHVRALFEAALWDFFVMVTLWLAKNLNRDPRAVLDEVPLTLPLHVPRQVDEDSRLGRVFVLATFSEEYPRFLDRVQRIKAMLLSRTDRVRALIKALPGAATEDAERWCLKGWSPFEIALDYMRIRYGLRTVGSDTLRKWLTLARDPQRMVEAVIVDLERRQGPLPRLRVAYGMPAAPESPAPRPLA